MQKKVQIKSVTPNDRYNVVGEQGYLETETLVIGRRLIVYINERFLHTSPIKEIKETLTDITVTTKNSVYEFDYIKQEEI